VTGGIEGGVGGGFGGDTGGVVVLPLLLPLLALGAGGLEDVGHPLHSKTQMLAMANIRHPRRCVNATARITDGPSDPMPSMIHRNRIDLKQRAPICSDRRLAIVRRPRAPRSATRSSCRTAPGDCERRHRLRAAADRTTGRTCHASRCRHPLVFFLKPHLAQSLRLSAVSGTMRTDRGCEPILITRFVIHASRVSPVAV